MEDKSQYKNIEHLIKIECQDDGYSISIPYTRERLTYNNHNSMVKEEIDSVDDKFVIGVDDNSSKIKMLKPFGDIDIKREDLNETTGHTNKSLDAIETTRMNKDYSGIKLEIQESDLEEISMTNCTLRANVPNVFIDSAQQQDNTHAGSNKNSLSLSNIDLKNPRVVFHDICKRSSRAAWRSKHTTKKAVMTCIENEKEIPKITLGGCIGINTKKSYANKDLQHDQFEKQKADMNLSKNFTYDMPSIMEKITTDLVEDNTMTHDEMQPAYMSKEQVINQSIQSGENVDIVNDIDQEMKTEVQQKEMEETDLNNIYQETGNHDIQLKNLTKKPNSRKKYNPKSKNHPYQLKNIILANWATMNQTKDTNIRKSPQKRPRSTNNTIRENTKNVTKRPKIFASSADINASIRSLTSERCKNTVYRIHAGDNNSEVKAPLKEFKWRSSNSNAASYKTSSVQLDTLARADQQVFNKLKSEVTEQCQSSSLNSEKTDVWIFPDISSFYVEEVNMKFVKEGDQQVKDEFIALARPSQRKCTAFMRKKEPSNLLEGISSVEPEITENKDYQQIKYKVGELEVLCTQLKRELNKLPFQKENPIPFKGKRTFPKKSLKTNNCEIVNNKHDRDRDSYNMDSGGDRCKAFHLKQNKPIDFQSSANASAVINNSFLVKPKDSTNFRNDISNIAKPSPLKKQNNSSVNTTFTAAMPPFAQNTCSSEIPRETTEDEKSDNVFKSTTNEIIDLSADLDSDICDSAGVKISSTQLSLCYQ